MSNARVCPKCRHNNQPDAGFCERCGTGLALHCPSCDIPNSPDARYCKSCGSGLGSTPPAAAPDLPVSFAAGRYEVKGFLGEGARKRVYLARDRALERDVALASIKTDGLDPESMTRVRTEAQAMGRLGDHPNIVTVFDVFEERGFNIVSQYMSGGSVEDLLRDSSSGLPMAKALEVGEQVAAALEHSHANGIVHRDVKPANVWIASDGTTQLGDFGLAITAGAARLTIEGMMVGTASYMSPEQASGARVDSRSDLYSFGVMLYELITGRPPFMGDDIVGVISQHVSTAPVAPSLLNPSVPKPLEDLVLRLLAKSPDDRPAGAGDVRRALAAMRAGPVDQAEAMPLPSEANPLDRLAAGVFVGRDRETAELRQAMDRALTGTPQLIMLVGEPGIGKTRTAEELATYARLKGALVLMGRCYEGEGAPPYWPWIQIVRSYISDRSPQELLAQMGSGASDIATVVPEVRERLPGLPAAPESDPDAARFRFFEAISNFLKEASQIQPLLMILDDLHWADKPSLLLLRFLARELRSAPLLGIGTYRDVDLGRHHPLAQTMAELTRENVTKRILLRGLTEEDVARFIELTAATKPNPQMVSAVFRETEGNPFFLAETVRLLAQEGTLQGAISETRWSLTIPQGVKEVIGRRLNQLSEDTNAILSSAAVIGREFNVNVLERAAQQPRDAILDALEEALAARLVTEVPGAIGKYRFSHALVRETLYDELTTTRRIRMHLRIGAVLEELHGEDERYVAELAYHFFEAAAAGEAEKAARYSVLAADRAITALAYEEAAEMYEKAVQALEQSDSADHQQIADVRLSQATALLASGEVRAAEKAIDDASERAKRIGNLDLLARAAMQLGDVLVSAGWSEQKLIDRLEEAISALPTEDSSMRARLLGRLGEALRFTPRRDEERSLSLQAVEMARRLGDDQTLAITLFARVVALGGPDTSEERFEAVDELIEVSERIGDDRRKMLGLRIRTMAIENGHLDLAIAAVEEYERLANKLKQPLFLWFVPLLRSELAFVSGDLDKADELLQEALRQGQEAHEPNLAAFTWPLRLHLATQLGKLAEIRSDFQEGAKSMNFVMWANAMLMFLEAEVGDQEEAKRMAADVLAEARGHKDWSWMGGMSLLVDVIDTTGLIEVADEVYNLLLPYADSYAVTGMFSTAGSVHRPLGTLARLLGRHEEALTHHRAAVEADSRFPSPLLTARSRFELARTLLEAGQEQESLEEANSALDSARRLKMTRLIQEILKFKLGIQGALLSSSVESIHAVARSVVAERPNLALHAGPEGVVTLLFSDIENSTPLTQEVGDEKWLQILKEHNELIRQEVSNGGGQVVKTQGDGFMVAFSSARSALRSAIVIQQKMKQRDLRAGDVPIRVRIGLHTGEAVRVEGDFFGRHVNLASRVASQAKGGQILVSLLTRDLVAGSSDFEFSEPWEVDLKGVSDTQKLVELRWDGDAETPVDTA